MEEKELNYVVYHLHSDFSLLDSCTKFEDYINRAKELNQKAICITEHGNIMHWVAKKEACDKAGIKYLHGCEVYLTAQLQPKIRDNYHTILIAKNMNGLKELNQLISTSNKESHFYFKPRISFEEFLNISDNVIKISACLASPLARLEDEMVRLETTNDITDEEKQRLEYLKDHFNNVLLKYDYYEIQPHINSEEQKVYNKRLFEWAKKYNKPLIAGTDTHSLNQYKAECRSILQLAKGIEFTNEDQFDLTYKSYDELVHMFEEQNVLPKNIYLQAIENTNVMADSCEEIILDKEFKYPKVYDDDIATIKSRLWEMLKEKVSKGVIPREQMQLFIDNIKTELAVFEKINMCGFMLFMSDLIKWCHESNIPTGFGRGSCFTKDNLVLTQNGYKFINEINSGELVYTHAGNLRRVLDVQQFKVSEKLYNIRYKGEGSYYKVYPVTCTGDHKFLIKRNDDIIWMNASELKLGDKLYYPKIVNNFSEAPNQIIDLNKYNIYNYEYDEHFIYEKYITNKPFLYSSHDMQKRGLCSPSVIKRISNKYKFDKPTAKELEVLNYVPFESLEEYANYLRDNKYRVRKISRYIEMDELTNTFIGLMYGDGWTLRNYGVGLAINHTTKINVNKNILYRMAKRLNTDVYENEASNTNLIQLIMNSHIINNWIKTEYFESVRGKEKIFNKDLLNQSNKNLKALRDGLILSDGSTKRQRVSFDNSSLSLISFYKIINDILAQPNLSLDVRPPRVDDRGYKCKQSYKLRESSIKSQWLDIIEINNSETTDTTVYDLTVDIDHSFIVNNIAVHNCCGSVVAYILDIIDVNPIKWKTVFSRFANEDRKEIGDIDTDFAPSDRDAVYNHMIEEFGEQYTAYILAIGTVSDKGCIDEIGRALYRKTGKDTYSLENMKKIKKDFENNPELAREKYNELFYYFDGLLNTNISQSMHPCGMVVSPITLEDNYGVLYRDGKKILQIDMEDVHEISLVKYDLLCLKNIGIIKDACEYANIPYPKSNEINWDDQKVWEDMLRCPEGIDKLFMYPLTVMLSKKTWLTR